MRKLHALLGLGVLLACDSASPGAPTARPSYVQVWRSAASGLSRSALDDCCMYVTDTAHVVSAIRKVDGSIKWRRQLTYPTAPGLLGGFGLVIAQGRVIVGDIDVFGLDAATGDILWRFAPPLPRERTGRGHLSTDGTTVYAGGVWGNVYALDPLTGLPRWTTAVGSDSFLVNDPVCFEDAVYVGLALSSGTFEGGAAAVDALSGRLLWSVRVPRSASFPTGAGAPGVTSNLVVIAAADGAVYGLDRFTGATKYTIPVDSFLAPGEGIGEKAFRVRAFDNTVYVGTTSGVIVALDGTSMKIKWKVRVGTLTIWDLSADSTRVYLAAGNVGLIALDAASGEEVWRTSPADLADPSTGKSEVFVSAPSIGPEAVYIGGANLASYAFKQN